MQQSMDENRNLVTVFSNNGLQGLCQIGLRLTNGIAYNMLQPSVSCMHCQKTVVELEI